jgi:hypothetical protein
MKRILHEKTLGSARAVSIVSRGSFSALRFRVGKLRDAMCRLRIHPGRE